MDRPQERIKDNRTLGGVKITTRILWAHGRAKCTIIEYRTLNGSQGGLVEYRVHSRDNCTAEKNGLPIHARDTMMWMSATKTVIMQTHTYDRGRVR